MEALPTAPHKFHTVLYFLVEFFDRHWLIGVENAALTALLGGIVVALITSVGGELLSPHARLSLKRLVCLVALCKGALYVVLGVSAGKAVGPAVGLQIPDIRQVLLIMPQDAWSIWRPTTIALVVTQMLLGYAAVCLALRVWFLSAARKAVSQARVRPGDEMYDELREALVDAATIINTPRAANTEVCVVSALDEASPFVIGFFKPAIVVREDVLRKLVTKTSRLCFRQGSASRPARSQRRYCCWTA